LYGASNARTHERPHVQTLEEFSAYGEPGGVKMAFGFNAEDLGDGWCVVTTETRVFALDRFTRRGMARYWRLIVPGSGLLRRQWLEGIKQRAENPQAVAIPAVGAQH
jgi:hypothetical protein